MIDEFTEEDFLAAILRNDFDVKTLKFIGNNSFPSHVQRTYESWRDHKIENKGRYKDFYEWQAKIAKRRL